MKKESTVRVRLDTELQEKFAQTCDAYGMQRSKVLRILINEFCESPQDFIYAGEKRRNQN